ncbi:hypothetical protein HDE_04595 [Halotydeus destructor]|nr:hypothetical protein HDE_04595 [Halotydeus destructor]
MTSQVSAKSEIAADVDSITEAAGSLTFIPTTITTSVSPTADDRAEIRIYSGDISIPLDVHYAREVSGRVLKEYMETGVNTDIELPPAQAYIGDLHDIGTIFNRGVVALVIRNELHVSQLRGLAAFLNLPALVIRLDYD